jgi:hypothetical protein
MLSTEAIQTPLNSEAGCENENKKLTAKMMVIVKFFIVIDIRAKNK